MKVNISQDWVFGSGCVHAAVTNATLTPSYAGHGWIHTLCCRLSPRHRGSSWPSPDTYAVAVCFNRTAPLFNIPFPYKFSPLISLHGSLSLSLLSEVGHSGSTVYSDAAASGREGST